MLFVSAFLPILSALSFLFEALAKTPQRRGMRETPDVACSFLVRFKSSEIFPTIFRAAHGSGARKDARRPGTILLRPRVIAFALPALVVLLPARILSFFAARSTSRLFGGSPAARQIAALCGELRALAPPRHRPLPPESGSIVVAEAWTPRLVVLAGRI